MVESEVVNPIFPGDVFGHLFVNAEGSIEVLRENGAELRLEDIDPKVFVVLFLVFLFEKFVEVIKIDNSDLISCLSQIVHKVTAP